MRTPLKNKLLMKRNPLLKKSQRSQKKIKAKPKNNFKLELELLKNNCAAAAFAIAQERKINLTLAADASQLSAVLLVSVLLLFSLP